jgi:hypothetical protein
MYRDLMNMVRSEPYLPKFEVTKYLKGTSNNDEFFVGLLAVAAGR